MTAPDAQGARARGEQAVFAAAVVVAPERGARRGLGAPAPVVHEGRRAAGREGADGDGGGGGGGGGGDVATAPPYIVDDPTTLNSGGDALALQQQQQQQQQLHNHHHHHQHHQHHQHHHQQPLDLQLQLELQLAAARHQLVVDAGSPNNRINTTTGNAIGIGGTCGGRNSGGGGGGGGGIAASVHHLQMPAQIKPHQPPWPPPSHADRNTVTLPYSSLALQQHQHHHRHQQQQQQHQHQLHILRAHHLQQQFEHYQNMHQLQQQQQQHQQQCENLLQPHALLEHARTAAAEPTIQNLPTTPPLQRITQHHHLLLTQYGAQQQQQQRSLYPLSPAPTTPALAPAGPLSGRPPEDHATDGQDLRPRQQPNPGQQPEPQQAGGAQAPRRRQKRSFVWQFFRESAADLNIAICLLCNAVIPRGRRLARNTTNLRKHLQHRHPDELSKAGHLPVPRLPAKRPQVRGRLQANKQQPSRNVERLRQVPELERPDLPHRPFVSPASQGQKPCPRPSKKKLKVVAGRANQESLRHPKSREQQQSLQARTTASGLAVGNAGAFSAERHEAHDVITASRTSNAITVARSPTRASGLHSEAGSKVDVSLSASRPVQPSGTMHSTKDCISPTRSALLDNSSLSTVIAPPSISASSLRAGELISKSSSTAARGRGKRAATENSFSKAVKFKNLGTVPCSTEDNQIHCLDSRTSNKATIRKGVRRPSKSSSNSSAIPQTKTGRLAGDGASRAPALQASNRNAPAQQPHSDNMGEHVKGLQRISPDSTADQDFSYMKQHGVPGAPQSPNPNSPRHTRPQKSDTECHLSRDDALCGSALRSSLPSANLDQTAPISQRDDGRSDESPFETICNEDSEICAALVQYLRPGEFERPNGAPLDVNNVLNRRFGRPGSILDGNMRARAVTKLAKLTRNAVCQKLSDIRGCALVISDVAHNKVVTCLWLTPAFEYRSLCLGVLESSSVPQSSTDDFLACVGSIAQIFGVLCVTNAIVSVQRETETDQGTRRKVGWKYMKNCHASDVDLFGGPADAPGKGTGSSPTGLLDQSPSIPSSSSLNCAIVALEKILESEIFMSPSLLSLFQAIRVAIRMVRTEPDLYASNRSAAGLDGEPPLILDEDTEVSMWTARAMLARFAEQRVALDHTLEDMSGSDTIGSVDLELIQHVLAILDMFIEAVRILHPASRASRRAISASIAVTIPVIKGLKRTLVSKTLNVSGTSIHYEFYQSIYSAVECAFPNVETCATYVIATVIDPRFKSRVFESADDREAAERILFSACIRNSHPVTSTVRTHCNAKQVPDAVTMETSDDCGSNGISWENDSLVEEAIEAYLREPALDFCADIEEYWRLNSKRWPSLGLIASMYLCVPASTKILQSLAGLSPEHFQESFRGGAESQQLLFVRQNLQSGLTFGVSELDSHL